MSTGSIPISASSFRSWSRRCSSATCVLVGGARPVRRLGDDARAGARVRLRRRRGRYRSVQRAPRSVKTREHDLQSLDADVGEVGRRLAASTSGPTGFVADWFAPQAAAELLHFRSLIAEHGSQDVLRVVLARAARSARLTTTSTSTSRARRSRASTGATSTAGSAGPVESASKFLSVTWATPQRGSGVRRGARSAAGCARAPRRRAGARTGRSVRRVVTSPPYPGLIDYHEQHRYAYELLGLDDRRERELGAAARGTSRAAIEEYVAGIAAVLARVRTVLRRGAPVCIVVNDRRDALPGDPRACRSPPR